MMIESFETVEFSFGVTKLRKIVALQSKMLILYALLFKVTER